MAGLCKNCGTRYEDGARFCTECGAVLNVGSTSSGSAACFNTTEQDEKSLTVNEVNEPIGEDNIALMEGEQPQSSSENENTSNDSSSNPYGAPNGGAPYGGYVAPNGGNPYGGYNAPNGGAPYGGYGAPNGGNQYGGYGVPNGGYYGGNNGGNRNVRPINVGMLIFSIINLILSCCGCTGIIFGGGALAFTVMARTAATDEDASKYNKIALILNIIGVVSFVLVIISVVVMGFLEGMFYESL